MPIADAPSLIDYAKTLDCIHCGLCLRTCPTYQLTGVESSSPRGRIHLMRAVAEARLEPDRAFAEEMDFCLLCRHCESVCPAGVRFSEMMEHTRGALAERGPQGAHQRVLRWLGFRVLLPHRSALRVAAGCLRLAQRLGLWPLCVKLLGRRGRTLAHFPRVQARERLPTHAPARGERRGEAALLEGCVMPELYGRVNRATLESLQALGVECHVPRAQVCCGSLHAHNGDLAGARALAQRNIEAFEEEHDASGGPLAIVVNSAGCGSHMKAYQHLFDEQDAWHARARAFGARVKDYSEFAAPLLEAGYALRAPLQSIEGPVAWDDPCHLCHGQQIRSQPRALLDAVCRAAGLERVELPDSESCCGSAGIYSLARPEDSQAVLAPKLESLARSGARTLVTANPGCQLQWETGIARAGLEVRVLHLAELVAPGAR